MKPILILLLVVAAVAALAQGIMRKYPPSVSLDVPTKRKLVEKALTLKAGDSLQTVTNTLGKPTTDGNWGSDYHVLDYHMKAWSNEWTNPLYQPSADTEYVRVRLNQSNRIVSVWILAELVQPW